VQIRHFTPIGLGVLAGTALQLTQPQLWPLWSYLGLVLLALLLGLLLRRVCAKPLSHFLLWCLLSALITFGSTGWRATVFSDQALAPALEGQDILVTGLVSSLPQSDATASRFLLQVESAELSGQALVLPAILDLSWYRGVFARGDGPGELMGELQRLPAVLVAGQRWRMVVRLKAIHGGVNPHGFDYELWQWERGVQASGYVRAGPKDPTPILLAQTWWHLVDWARAEVRDRISQQVVDERAAGLIAALVVGDQQAIEQSDWDVFRATGVAHLMSISGLHVTMFAWFAGVLVAALWRRSAGLCARVSAPSAALVGGLLLAAAYALFSGWGVPAQRTVWMLATVGLLRLLGLRWPWPQVWLLTCAVVVLMDPWALLQAGFWLSFVAVGVLFATDHSGAGLPKPGIRQRLLGLLREQWLITLALAPLSLLLFGQVSLIALLANAVAIPWVTLLITPLAMAGVLWSGFWELCHWASLGLLLLLSWLAQWPWASYQVPQAPAWIGAASVLGALLLVLRAPWAWRLLGLPLLLPLVMWRVPMPPAGQFEILAADIGQGNAVLLRTQSHSLLFDAGPRFSQESDAGHRVLLPLMRSLGVKLDMLVLSHQDTDHTGGAVSVLNAQPTAQLLSSIGSEHPLQALRPVQPCTTGQHWRWDGVDFELLHPSRQELQERHKTNALSCVLRVSNGQQTALLTGDIEQAQETQLLALGDRLQAQWLMVPHHGSKTSSSGAFLDAVAPQFALVQAGYRNRFGHPAGPVLVRYQERKISLVDTPHCGAATWRSWQPEAMACERRRQAHYWRHRLP